MPDDAVRIEAYERRIAELEALVAAQAETIERLQPLNERLEARVAQVERQLGQNSGNSGKPPSRDSAAERQRQAIEREKRKAAGGAKRRKGKQRGAKGSGLAMSPAPDKVIDHRPEHCEGCGEEIDAGTDSDFVARQVIDLPEVAPVVTEHRAHACQCRCGHVSVGAFPDGVRAPVSYGPRIRATVAYLLGRQHLPNRRVAETLADLYGLEISGGWDRLDLLRRVAAPSGLHRRPGGLPARLAGAAR